MQKISQAIGLSIIISLLSFPTFAQSPVPRYKFDKTHTNIMWFASHFGFSDSMGQFMDYDGYVMFDENAPEKSQIEITIKTTSIMTGLEDFDKHLRNKDFFDVEKFPTARFRSKSVKVTGDNTANVEGDFTMLGITKPLTLKVTFNKKGINPYNKKETIGFSASTIINRLDYGMKYGAPAIGTDVKIKIETELTK